MQTKSDYVEGRKCIDREKLRSRQRFNSAKERSSPVERKSGVLLQVK